jgi:hypothetical protein
MIFTPQVLRRVTTQKELQTVKLLAPLGKINEVFGGYNQGQKTKLESWTSKKALA